MRTAELEESNQLLKLEIDRRKEVEAKLRHSQERLDLALHSANDGIWDWDLASGALFFDTRYYTMAGYEPNAFPSTFEQWEKRVHCEDIDSSKKAISDYLAGITDSFEAEFRFKRGEGTYMWIRGKGKIVARDDRGNPVRFIGTHSDITESKVAEEELQKAKRLISNIINIHALIPDRRGCRWPRDTVEQYHRAILGNRCANRHGQTAFGYPSLDGLGDEQNHGKHPDPASDTGTKEKPVFWKTNCVTRM